MNKQRRKEIKKIIESIEQAKIELDMVMVGEQDVFDNIPWSLEEGESAEQSQDAIEAMETAIGQLEEAIDTIDVAPAVKVAREVLTKQCKQCGARNMLYKKLCFKCFCPSFHEPTEK